MKVIRTKTPKNNALNLKKSDNKVGGIINDLAKLVLEKPEPDLNFDVYIQVVIIPDVSDKFTYSEIQLDGENCVKIPRYTCA
jgi:hypothetical protein